MTESLLKKYDIPINHLDFDYIKSCKNVKEIERIVTVLKSGEEGYYPDLTDCAVEKLKLLSPSSKILREEFPVLTKRSMDNEEWKRISTAVDGWADTMKKHSGNSCKSKPFDECDDVYPIRQFSEKNSEEMNSAKNETKRIKSCDYAQWDKYDPEVEMLKMDINDEQQVETVKMKNRNHFTAVDPATTQQLADKLAPIEKEDLANKHRIKGNEFYKAADFDDAIKEYSHSIQILPTAAAFNNRAIAYFKIKNFELTITDCDQCLRLEPYNVKALLRKAQALLMLSKYCEAYEQCTKILSIEFDNEWAKGKMMEIKPKMAELPPANAFRMKIVEDEKAEPQTSGSNQSEYNFADLIIPNKVYPSKLSKLKSNFVLDKKRHTTNKKTENKTKTELTDDVQLIIPGVNNSHSKSKITEYQNGVIIEEL